MDDKECIRGRFRFAPTTIRLDTFADKYNPKKRPKQRSIFSDEKISHGDILYVQNPIFNHLSLGSRDDSPHNCEFLPTNSTHKNVKKDNRNSCQIPSTSDKLCKKDLSHKSRRDRMKARAENRRDSLFSESSDDDYSSVNSYNDLRPVVNNNKHSNNMDDAYNRKSRSARTERYFHRLSREDIHHENDFNVSKINATKRNQNAKLHLPQSFHYNNSNNHGDRSPNALFFNRDNTMFNNPIYNTSETLYQPCSRKEISDDQIYAANIDRDSIRRSGPGGDAVLAYKKIKPPRTVDRVQYVEPNLYAYQFQSQEIGGQNKPVVNKNRLVKRSFSFQSEIPKEYQSRIDATVSLMKHDSNKIRNSDQISERKWIDSIASSTTKKPDATLSSGDFQRRKLYPPKNVTEVKSDDKNLTINYDEMSLRKRTSKDLEKELSELEKMYISLRLSDDNLLERAEERCAEEFSLKGQSRASNNDFSKNEARFSSSESIADDDLLHDNNKQSSEAHVINDDMAYRKMQSKKMPALSETQNSLSQISYLLASSALILDKTDYPEFTSKTAKEEPNITKDDVVYRNLHYANNVLKVVEPQPPFGIPLRPATPSTNSNYLCSSPVAMKSPPLKFVPQSEPNLITDDLAFRNLRKDAPKTAPVLSECNSNDVDNIFPFKNEIDKSLTNDNDDNEKFFKKKRKAVRSLSANLYGLINEVKNLDFNIK